MGKYQFRPLTNADLFRVTDIVVDAVDAGSSKIGKILTPETGGGARPKKKTPVDKKKADALLEKQGIQTATMIIRECWKYAKEETQAWFADLCGMTTEEYMDAPAGMTMALFEYFVEDEDNRNFFSQALRVVNRVNGYAGSFLAGLGPSGDTSD